METVFPYVESKRRPPPPVMAGLVPAIHVFAGSCKAPTTRMPAPKLGQDGSGSSRRVQRVGKILPQMRRQLRLAADEIGEQRVDIAAVDGDGQR